MTEENKKVPEDTTGCGWGCFGTVIIVALIAIFFVACSAFGDDCDVDLNDFNGDGDVGVTDYDIMEQACEDGNEDILEDWP